MSNNDKELTTLKAFEVVIGYARQIENRAWNALYNFLTGNSILVLAWATLYQKAADSLAPLLIGLPVVGFLLSLGWATFGARNFAYNQVNAEKLDAIQEDEAWLKCKLLPQVSDDITNKIQNRGLKFFFGYQSSLLAGTPLWFSIIYVGMELIALCKLEAHVAWFVASLLIAAGLFIWAAVACLNTAYPKNCLARLMARLFGASVSA